MLQVYCIASVLPVLPVYSVLGEYDARHEINQRGNQLNKGAAESDLICRFAKNGADQHTRLADMWKIQNGRI